MNVLKNTFLFILILLWFSSCAQLGDNNQKMIFTTDQVISSLKNCDSSKILNLLDTSFSHINKLNYRTYFKESFLEDCSLFNQIIDSHGLPNIQNITFKKDSSQLPPANIAVLPILIVADTTLNIKSCFLYLVFYPDIFFVSNSHLLKYSLVIEPLKERNTNKVEMPDWLKKLNGN